MESSGARLALADKIRQLAGPAHGVAPVAFLVLAAGVFAAYLHLPEVICELGVAITASL